MIEPRHPKNFLFTHEEMQDFDLNYKPNKSEMQRLGLKAHTYRQAVKGKPTAIKEFCRFLVEQIRYNETQVVYFQENNIGDQTFTLTTQLSFLFEEVDLVFNNDVDRIFNDFYGISLDWRLTNQPGLKFVLGYFLDHAEINLL